MYHMNGDYLIITLSFSKSVKRQLILVEAITIHEQCFLHNQSNKP